MFSGLRLFWIRFKLNLLAQEDVVYPIEIFSISRKIADLKSTKNAYKIVKQYFSHENEFVRRAVITAIRFMEYDAAKDFLEDLLKNLKEPKSWVTYDAAWALGESEVIDERIPTNLRQLAGEFVHMDNEQLEKYEPKETAEYVKKQAAESLRLYEKRS